MLLPKLQMQKSLHEWNTCCYAHAGEKAARRDPKHFAYNSVACPEMLQVRPAQQVVQLHSMLSRAAGSCGANARSLRNIHGCPLQRVHPCWRLCQAPDLWCCPVLFLPFAVWQVSTW
jgi:hypothetical protein